MFLLQRGSLILLVHTRAGTWASTSPKNQAQVPYLADVSGLRLFPHMISPVAVCVGPWTSVSALGQPCCAHYLSAALPCGHVFDDGSL